MKNRDKLEPVKTCISARFSKPLRRIFRASLIYRSTNFIRDAVSLNRGLLLSFSNFLKRMESKFQRRLSAMSLLSRACVFGTRPLPLTSLVSGILRAVALFLSAFKRVRILLWVLYTEIKMPIDDASDRHNGVDRTNESTRGVTSSRAPSQFHFEFGSAFSGR